MSTWVHELLLQGAGINGIGSDTGEKASLVAAVDAYSQAINIGEVGAEDYLAIAHCNRGCIRTDVLEDHNGAIQDFEMALKLVPTSSRHATEWRERGTQSPRRRSRHLPKMVKKEKKVETFVRVATALAASPLTMKLAFSTGNRLTTPSHARHVMGLGGIQIQISLWQCGLRHVSFGREERKNSDHFRLTK